MPRAVPAWHATPTPAAVVEPASVPPAVPPALATAIIPTPEATRRTRRDDATGRRRTPGAATLARICDPDDARGRGRGRTSRRVEVCARACPARACSRSSCCATWASTPPCGRSVAPASAAAVSSRRVTAVPRSRRIGNFSDAWPGGNTLKGGASGRWRLDVRVSQKEKRARRAREVRGLRRRKTVSGWCGPRSWTRSSACWP